MLMEQLTHLIAQVFIVTIIIITLSLSLWGEPLSHVIALRGRRAVAMSRSNNNKKARSKTNTKGNDDGLEVHLKVEFYTAILIDRP